MERWYTKIAPMLYTYAIAISVILVGSIHFITESDYIKGEVTTKKVLVVGENRDRYTETPIRQFVSIYSDEYRGGQDLEGTAVTLRNGSTGETDTIHVPTGMSGKDFLNQKNTAAVFYPYVYTGDLAKKDTEARYLLVVNQRVGGEIVIAVSEYQYERIDVGTYVTVKGERVVRRRF